MSGKMTTQEQIDALEIKKIISALLNACEFEKQWRVVREIQLSDMTRLAARFDKAAVDEIRTVSPKLLQELNSLSPLTSQYKQRAHAVLNALSTTPQPDRVAELEAKLKEYEQAIKAMVKDGWLSCGVEGLSEPQQKVYDLYQAMKG